MGTAYNYSRYEFLCLQQKLSVKMIKYFDKYHCISHNRFMLMMNILMQKNENSEYIRNRLQNFVNIETYENSEYIRNRLQNFVNIKTYGNNNISVFIDYLNDEVDNMYELFMF